MKEIIIKGAIGNTKIQNNESGRVFSGVGISGTIKSVSYKDPPKVVRSIKSIKRSRRTMQNSKKPVSEKQHCEFYG